MSEDNKKKGDESEKKDQDDFPTLSQIDSVEEIGTQIGPYKLLSVLGEGGFGIVYLAEQKEPVRRQVALKVIKPGMDSKQVIGRFEQERQALALLDHPNIAHIYDGGTTDAGRPYFVMELVRGLPITEYCDGQILSIEDRLNLFQLVCEAVQHAHQKGIIHRDLKPSNILVSVQSGKPVPMIIDFGVAKAISQPLTERTIFTEQDQFIGTLEYMSPEQAGMTIQGIDTRSDIYSLGVVLYELLTGILPFTRKELEQAGRAAIHRIIRETDPPNPSTRLSSLGDEAKKIAEKRHTEVAALARRLHKELEWIPLMAMRKEPERRYKTASELSDDIRNYLNGEPLLAGPESRSYRLRKTIKRHRVAVSAVAAVLIVLAVGIVVSASFAVLAVNAKKAEQRRAEDYRHSLYVNRINLAQKYYEENNISRVRELLVACPADLRKWEWYYLWRILDQAQITLRGHKLGVTCASFSPNGRFIISSSHDKTLKVWDAESGTEVMTLRGHKLGVTCMAFSPDGRFIVSGSLDKTLKVWDAESGSEVMTLRPGSHVNSVAFSPDGKRIISANDDKTVRLWDAKSGNELMTFRGHRALVTSVAFSPDGRRIVSGSDDDTLKIWDADNGGEVMTLRGHKGQVSSVAFSPDGSRIVSGSEDNTLKVWDAESGIEVISIREPVGCTFCSAVFSPDGKRIASGDADGLIKVWDAISGAEVRILPRHNKSIWSVAFSPDGSQIISGSEDMTVKVWDTESDRRVMTIKGHNGWIDSVAFSIDGKKMVSGGWDKILKVWDAKSDNELTILHGHSSFVLSVAFSPDSKRIISGSGDKTIKVWDVNSRREIMTLRGHTSAVRSVAFSPDGKRIISASNDKTVRLWDAKSGNELMTLHGHSSSVLSIAFSPNSKRIISGSVDKTIKVWDVNSRREIMTLRGHTSAVQSVAFSPNGRQIVSGSGDTLKVWDVESGTEVMTLGGHYAGVASVIFSQDGKRIISAGYGTVTIWDAESGSELMTLGRHESGIAGSAVCSPDGKRIVLVGAIDGTLKIWDSASPEEVVAEQLAEKEGMSYIRKEISISK